jgi:hypothetical protein
MKNPKRHLMGPLDALAHLAGFFIVPFALGALAALLARTLWRRDLAAVPWRHLAAAACAASVVAAVAGLVIFGRDGRMATHAAMVVACAVGLWWRGFGPGRPR